MVDTDPIRGVPRWTRRRLVRGIAIISIVIGTFLFSVDFSRGYWGYHFARPPVLSEIEDVGAVNAVVPIKTVGGDADSRTLVVDPGYSLAQSIAGAEADPYYCLEARLLMALRRKLLLPARVTLALTGLPTLHPLIRRTGILEQPLKGYTESDDLRGVAIEAVNHSGSRLVFIGVCGGQLANDHYPYYEMLFSRESETSRLTYLKGLRFFYDVAGAEGLEWYAMWSFLAVVGIVTWLAGTLVAVGTLKVIRHVQRRAIT